VYSYRDLEIYRLSMDLAVEVYSLKDTFPKQEIYGLTSQMRRCAVSIPSNIAEGSGRHGSKEFVQFLYMANGSMSELETQLEIAQRLKYIEDTSLILEKIKKIRPMLLKLVKVINEKSNPPKSSDGKQDDQHLC
jgi:four helix bundle protein